MKFLRTARGLLFDCGSEDNLSSQKGSDDVMINVSDNQIGILFQSYWSHVTLLL